MPFYARAFLCVLVLFGFWVALEAIERQINPQGFNLETQTQIKDNAQLSKQSLDVWQEGGGAATYQEAKP